MAQVHINLLGPLELRVGGTEIAIGGTRQLGLLALLSVNAGRVVSSRDLIAEVWPQGRAEEVKQNTLHAQINRLRSQIEPHLPLRSHRGGYTLDVDPDCVDISRFYQARNRAMRHAERNPAQAMVLLHDSLVLWRGAALQDCALGRRCQALAAGLEESRLQVHERLASLAVEQGEPWSVVDDLQELVVLHPMRETLLAALMAVLGACGRRAEALALFRQARARFDEELGIEPGPLMQRQHLAILHGEA